jgi:phage protein D
MSARYQKQSNKKPESVVLDLIIDGQRPSSKLLPRVMSASVDLGIDKTGMLTLEMESYDKKKDEPHWMDNEVIGLGKQIEVKMGYGNDVKSLFFGDIMGISASLSPAEPPTLAIRAYDRRHKLETYSGSRHFEKKTYTDIAADVALAAGLTPKGASSKVIHEYVEKINQSDMEFLEKLAREINYHVTVVGKNLIFDRVANKESEILTLTLENDLVDFSVDMSLALQSSAVVVCWWDPVEKKAIVSEAGSGTEETKMGGSVSASQLYAKHFGSAAAEITNHPVRSQAEADQLAAARLNQTALGLIEATGSIMGSTQLVPGKVIKITGAGNRFSGRYYVTSATHRIDHKDGYRTKFTARRNAQ